MFRHARHLKKRVRQKTDAGGLARTRIIDGAQEWAAPEAGCSWRGDGA